MLFFLKRGGKKHNDRQFQELFQHPAELLGLPGARRDGGVHLYLLNFVACLV